MTYPEPGVLLLDDDRVLVAVNELAAQMLGHSESTLVGRRADEFMPMVARAIYPLAWKGFLIRRAAFGEYAALRPDGSLQHLAYAGFANRPIRGLHFFLIEPLPGEIDPAALRPEMQREHLQVGRDLPPDVRERLVTEADRAEWRLPLTKGANRAILAALFDRPEAALDALQLWRRLGSIEASVATAAGATANAPLTLLAGRVPYTIIGQAMEAIRDHGGRVMANVDERRA